MSEDKWTDALGEVCIDDFVEAGINKQFAELHGHILANAWFKALAAQIDFSVCAEAVKKEADSIVRYYNAN